MPRRGPRRITVTGVGTPPPLRPFAMEVLRILEAKQAAEREAKPRQGLEGRTAPHSRQDCPRRRADQASTTERRSMR